MHLQKFATYNEILVTVDNIANDILYLWDVKFRTSKMNLIYVLEGASLYKTALVHALNKICRKRNRRKLEIKEFPLRMKTYEGTEHKHNYKIEDVDAGMRATFDFSAPFLIVDDILDTGYTINTIIDHLIVNLDTKTNDIITNDKIVATTLVEKPKGDADKSRIDFICGFKTNHFVVGFGMDLNGRYRNIKTILELHNYEDNTHAHCHSCGDSVSIIDHTLSDITEIETSYPDTNLMLTHDFYKKSNRNKPICNKCWGKLMERAYSTYSIAFH